MEEITVIILTKNEEKNIREAILSAQQISKRIIVVDSGSSDATKEIAKKCDAEVFFHQWQGHAKQFNWALDNCDIQTEWVFRLDADERISKDLAAEINRKMTINEIKDLSGFSMRWRVCFMGKWLRHGGTHKPYFLRLFRYGKGRVEERIMDEHILVDGCIQRLQGDLLHLDYKGTDRWLEKHIWYSNLELKMYQTQRQLTGGNMIQKQKRKFYYKLPMFLRAKLYYWYRYYVQLGFLDGKEGKIFCFLQAYWYRFLVDAKIYEEMRKGNANSTD